MVTLFNSIDRLNFYALIVDTVSMLFKASWDHFATLISIGKS